jgi:peptide/nickel transport system permease protein
MFGVVSYAAPVFFVGLMAQIWVAAPLGWPTSDIASPITKFQVEPVTRILLVDAFLSGDTEAISDVLLHHLLPCLVLGLLLSGVFIRLVRVNVLQTLKGDYVEAARARGIPEVQVMRRHAFRNALVPVITVIGLQVALTLSGAVLTERTFNWPGLGTQLVEYITARDYAAIQGLVTFFAIIVVFVSLVIDIVNALIDPRVRY